MSIARHHTEWLSLVEVSGPFLSLPVLMQVFPQGLDAHEAEVARQLRLAFEEWEAEQTTRAIHRAWVLFVLKEVLQFPDEVIAEGQAIPAGMEARMAEHGETLRPDLAIVTPHETSRNTNSPLEGGQGGVHLLIQILPPTQDLEKPLTGKHWKASPATRMMELLHAANVPLGLVTNGEHWMLVNAPRGETTGFAAWYASLWIEEKITLRAFRSLLAVHRFFGVADNETLKAMLVESAQNQQDVTDQLGYQVRRAVEVLVQTFDRIDQDSGRKLLQGIDEKQLYNAALTVMMRLVFLFSAEERDLLLLGDPFYDQNYAVSTLRESLREMADQHGEELLERCFDAWSRLLATFRVVYGGVGHDAMRLPPYGGHLFDPDRYPFLEGRQKRIEDAQFPSREGQGVGKKGSKQRKTQEPTPNPSQKGNLAAAPLKIDNRTVLHLLESLQMLQVKLPGGGPAEARRLSFRSLDIEQIGHVYEGLLDHTAKRTKHPIVGLRGTKNKEPEILLQELERLKRNLHSPGPPQGGNSDGISPDNSSLEGAGGCFPNMKTWMPC